MTSNTSELFEPSKIGAVTVRNKLAVAPMSRVSALEDGVTGPLMKAYYEDYAQGGFGIIITEGLYTDEHYSQGYYKQPGIATNEQAASWQPILEAVHNQHAVIIAQLMHAGALSQHNRFTANTQAPSAVKPKGQQMSFYYGTGDYRLPEALTVDEIKKVVRGFVDSALNAKSAGFDGVEIHGANGYLLDQFLTDYTNQREDEYGGSLTNRLRIFKEIIEAVRTAVGDEFIVGVRVSQKKVNDTEHLWHDGEKAAEQIFSLIKDSGADYIHTAEPVASEPAFPGSASLASLAKKYSGLPIIANGGIQDSLQATNVLENAQADFVSLGKVALANPDWPNLLKKGERLKSFEFAMLAPIADLANAKSYFSSQLAQA